MLKWLTSLKLLQLYNSKIDLFVITKKHFNLICMKIVLLFQKDDVSEKS